MGVQKEAPLPFELGTYDTTGAFAHLLGREYVVEYRGKTAPTSPAPGGRLRKVKLCFNNSGATLLPQRLVQPQLTAGAYGYNVAGYSRLTAERVIGGIDEFLPSAGVPDQAYFWVVVKGPAKLLMPLSQVADIAVGDALVAITAATTGATTAGRVASQDLTGATALLAQQVQNLVGYALSAVSSSSTTNTPILVDLAGPTW